MPRHYSTAAAPVQWAQRPNFPVFSAGFLPIIPMRKFFSACCPKKGNPPAILRKIPGTGRGSPPDGKKRLPDATASGSPGGGWWIRTTEGVASRFTVCPLWPLGKSPIYEVWSWWTDSNPRPADYKSAALPAELHQRLTSEDYITRLHLVCQQKFSPLAGIFYINRHRHHIHPCTQERGGS